MASEDELCDQEALEALLDDADDFSGCSQKIAAPNSNCSQSKLNSTSSQVLESCDKSVEDFLNAHSDDSSDEDYVTKKVAVHEAFDDDEETEILASMMDDDSDLEATKPDSRGDEKSSSFITSAGRKTESMNSQSIVLSKPTRQEPEKNVLKLSHPKSSVDSLASNHLQDKPLAGQTNSLIPTPSVMSIQEEMLKMQAKMMELQKMLEQTQHMEKSQSPAIQAPKFPPTKNLLSDKTSKNPVLHPEKKTMDAKDKVHHLTLLSDDDPGFLQQSPNSSKKPPQANPISNKNLPASSKGKRSKMESELFGDSDSDWEGMDGEDKRNLSDVGRDLKRLMQSGERKREAHQPKFEMMDASGGKDSSWKSSLAARDEEESDGKKPVKNILHCNATSSSQGKPTAAESEKIFVEDFSKIRIVNPLVSSSLMKMRMEGRKLIPVSKIHRKLKTPDLQGDWVTIAVVVGKTDSKSSNSGKPYCIWKLNDLEDLDNSVSFFLFGDVHKQLWKTDIGTAIGVLNPSIMESMEKSNSEPAFTVRNPNQVMIMGRSKDLGWCMARTKAGNKCIKFINKKFGDYCAYHVAAEYRKTSAKRLELQGSITGVTPKSFEKKVFAKDCAYIYGGNTYVPNSSQKGKKTGVSLKKLQQNLLGQGKTQKVNTLTISEVMPVPSIPTVNRKIQEDKDNVFMDLIGVPSPGSMNLVAFLKKNESSSTISSKSKVTSQTKTESITAKELIKQHQTAMRQKLTEKKKASELLLAGTQASSPAGQLSISDPLKEIPKLGKGFYSGQQISLDVSPSSMSLADRTKLKALAAIKNKGGLKKEDPNAMKKAEGVDAEKIRKRLSQDCEKRVPSAANSSNQTSEPPKKKAKLLGNVDLNSEEVKSILKAKSKHVGALAEAEAEREEVYFNELEKKEKMEEKLQTITSIEIKVVTCKQCLYTAQSALDSCKQDNHTLVTSKAKKRFFMCKKCKHRTYVIGEKLPTQACSKCGNMSYEKTSMYKIRAGPKLESEVLNIRGDEIKFINSLDNKVFLNTVIDK